MTLAVPVDDQVPLVLTINHLDQGGVTGKSPTVAVRRAETSNDYLDFSDDVFKTSGWTTRQQPLTEIGNGQYQHNLDLSALSLTAGDKLVAEYDVDDGANVVGSSHELIVTQAEVETLREVWRILGLDPAQPLTVSAVERTSGSVITQTINTAGSTVTVTRV